MMRPVAIYIFLPISAVALFWFFIGIYMMVFMPEYGFRWSSMDYGELGCYGIGGIMFGYVCSSL